MSRNMILATALSRINLIVANRNEVVNRKREASQKIERENLEANSLN
jgi:hypothetical protein